MEEPEPPCGEFTYAFPRNRAGAVFSVPVTQEETTIDVLVPAASDDLPFGLVALQNGLVNQGQLVAAFQAWTLDKSRPLAAHIVARHDLSTDGKAAVD